MKITDVKTFILKQDKIEIIGDGSQDTIVVGRNRRRYLWYR